MIYRIMFVMLLLQGNLVLAIEVSVSASLLPPFANVYFDKEGGKIRPSGITYLLGQYIQRHSGQATQYRVIKREDMDQLLRSGAIESVCNITEKWLGVKRSEVVYSKPYMRVRDQLISRKVIPLIKELKHLRDLNIGLVSGYTYPALTPALQGEVFNPIYHNNEANSFISLFRDPQMHAIVFTDVAFRHFVSSMPEVAANKAITVHPLDIGAYELACALPHKHRHLLPVFNQAIEEFVADQGF